MTPLMLAAEQGHFKVVGALLEHTPSDITKQACNTAKHAIT